MQELAPTESRNLAECEGVIERGLKTFTEVGNALLQIRDGRLYRESHATFEDYCRERWGFSRIRAHQIIEASAVVQNFEQSGLPAPTVESQARELARVPEPERAQVWAKTIEHTDGKPTAAAIRQIYRPAPVPAPLPAPRPTDADLMAGTEWSAAPEPTPTPIPTEDQLLDAIEKHQPGARAEVDKARVRAQWSRAFAALSGLPLLSPELASAAVTDTELGLASAAVEDAQRWISKIRAARQGLRLIEGSGR